MDTKYQSCQSKASLLNNCNTSCCSPTTTPLKVADVESDGCCHEDSDVCSAKSDPKEERAPSGSSSLYTQSWRIEGMDCPSCARKIETAVNNINGVSHAKVLFATEKLVVTYKDVSLIKMIETVALENGFSLNSNLTRSSTGDELRYFDFFKQNIRLVSLTIAMLVSFALQSFFPNFSAGSFVAICLLGLMPIVRKAIILGKSGTPFSIETLMSVAAIGALYLGETAEAAMVLLLFLMGEKLEAYASSRARSGVQSLMALVPEEACKIIGGERISVAACDLVPGDLIEVSPGSRLPADGVIQSSASFDESALTGESLPVEHHQGDQVLAGSVAVDKVVQLQVTSQQGENAIDRILHLIEEAESHKAPLERFLDKFSRWYTPAMMLLALVVIITPPLLFQQPWETWVYRGLALLLIACPCALVISTPAAITSGLAVAAKRGALIKGGAALEQLGRVETVAFDKTGTLTMGKPKVTDVFARENYNVEQLLSVSASIEVGSTHPLAQSLVNYTQKKNIKLQEATEKTALVGIGVTGTIEGEIFSVVSPSKLGRQIPNEIKQQLIDLEILGKTTVLVLENEIIIGIIAWQDTLRADAKDTVNNLGKMGINTIMLTGDNRLSAKGIADQMGIEYEASLLPEDKVGFIQQLAREKYIAMVGDGINDAPAMKAASIGVAMGSGTDVALEAADAALTHNRLSGIADIILISKATLTNIKQNVALALVLKAIFLVTSLLGITGLWLAVLADSGATLLVTVNALRLLRIKPMAQ